MKAAIIGGGFAADIHASALSACGVELAAVVTSRDETAGRFAHKWRVPRFGTDPEAALEDGIDAVHVCTPPYYHAAHITQALKAGKRVLCEKPLCFDTAQAHELAQLAEEAGGSGACCAVNYNVRYHMAVQKAREIITGGSLGRVLLIHGSYLQEFHILPCPYDWRYDPELSGGMRAISEIGSHWIDTVQYISGTKVVSVSAQAMSFFPDRVVRDNMMEKVSSHTVSGSARRIRVDTEDAASVSLRFENGAIGSVMLSEISPGRGNRLALEITCENGSLWWNEEENNVLHTAVRGGGVHSDIFAFGNGFNDTFLTLIQNFYSGREVPTFREGAQVAEVCGAIRQSAVNDSAWTRIGSI